MIFMPYIVSVIGQSDTGFVRHNNEDAWAEIPDCQLYVLADGMGGHRAGEVAARETIEMLSTLLKKFLSPPGKYTLEETQQIIRKTIIEVNSAIYRMGQKQESLRGMGTTLCCIYLHPEKLICSHVGDSRIYRFRKNHLEQLTQDHSLVRELMDLGQLSEHQAGGFLYKNIITRAVGTEPTVEPSISTWEVHPHDKYLMCTDGLSDQVSHSEIEEALKKQCPLKETAESLIALVNRRGGYDNTTLVLIEIEKIPKHSLKNVS
jgi:protein phosphatase